MLYFITNETYCYFIFGISGVVLFPEATLPLRVIQPNFIAAVDRALRQVEAPYTIGVVCKYLQCNFVLLFLRFFIVST